jgi:cytochrome bd-type quinol oxidase subunit 2
MIFRFLTIVAIAIWFGGFTFYSTAVISTSQELLHSHLRAGLITQQVTNWLNRISIIPLALCAINCWMLRKHESKRLQQFLIAALVVMVVLQAGLFMLYPMLDAKIVDREVMDAGNLFKVHRLYLVISTGQWCATLAYLWASLALWMKAPREAIQTNHA